MRESIGLLFKHRGEFAIGGWCFPTCLMNCRLKSNSEFMYSVNSLFGSHKQRGSISNSAILLNLNWVDLTSVFIFINPPASIWGISVFSLPL